MDSKDHKPGSGADDRRGTDALDSGRRRRRADLLQRQDEFRLRRDQALFAIGAIGVVGLGFAAVFINIRNPEIALAVLAACAGFLGAPTALRIDEKRRTIARENTESGET